MLIRGEMSGVHGKAALTAAPAPIPLSPLPTQLLGGLLLLIGP